MNKPKPHFKTTTSTPFLLVGLSLLVLFGLPLLIVIYQGISNDFIGHISNPTALQAFILSLFTSAISLVVCVIFGTPLAYGLSRLHFRGQRIVETLTDLPVVLPPAVAGVALLLTFGRRGALGPILNTLGINLPFTTSAVIIAQVFVAAPFYVRATRIGFAAIDKHYEETALVEGANAWQIFLHIMLPLAMRPVLSGMILAWTRALGEFGATIMFAGNLEGVSQTMPLAIYIGFERDPEIALALSVVLIMLSAIFMYVLRTIEDYSRHD
jgi:molybdate transport system permease protein